MKSIISIVMFVRALVGPCAFAQDSTARDAAAVAKSQEAAKIWLALADSGDYAQSWEQSAAPFQAGTSQAKWTTTAGAVRSSFGALK